METIRPAGSTAELPERRRSVRPQVEATRIRILRAAERLYAQRGFSGASLREIAVAANQGNNNAVQYHFGCRDRLIEAIFNDRVAEMEGERQAMLIQAEADGALDDAGRLLAILSLPYLSLRDEDEHHPHAGFLLHYLVHRMPDGTAKRLSTVFLEAPTMIRLLGLIRAQLGDIPDDIAETRMTLCAMMFLNLLVQHDVTNPVRGDQAALALHAKDTILAMTWALCGPAGGRTITA